MYNLMQVNLSNHSDEVCLLWHQIHHQLVRSFSPTSSSNSVGNGPPPTRVQYALVMPITSPICFGEIPKPVQTAAEIVLDEVTKWIGSEINI
jgi:hypothetical protein